MAHGIKQEWEEGTSPPPTSQVKQMISEDKRTAGKGMGSRRIFSPQFKLQVLHSYRNDSDCKGNQRATARKYGIHRRQIQKWLQMESHLRSAVESVAENRTNIAVSVTADCGDRDGDGMALNLSSARLRDDREIESTAGGIPAPLPVVVTATIQSSPLHPVAAEEEAPPPPPRSASPVSSDVEINVDDTSDSDDDISSSADSIYDQSDQALDFTCANLSKRRFFSANFKLEVLDAFYNDRTCLGNQRATARKFGIHRRQVQKWLQQEPILRSESGECLDLSCKKRKSEDVICHVEAKRVSPPPPTVWCPPCCAASDAEVTTSYKQETALCLVKPRTPHEVTSSVDLFYHPAPTMCYLSPTELPTYEPISSPCYTPYYPAYPIHDYAPKWFSHEHSANSIKVFSMYR